MRSVRRRCACADAAARTSLEGQGGNKPSRTRGSWERRRRRRAVGPRESTRAAFALPRRRKPDPRRKGGAEERTRHRPRPNRGDLGAPTRVRDDGQGIRSAARTPRRRADARHPRARTLPDPTRANGCRSEPAAARRANRAAFEKRKPVTSRGSRMVPWGVPGFSVRPREDEFEQLRFDRDEARTPVKAPRPLVGFLDDDSE